MERKTFGKRVRRRILWLLPAGLVAVAGWLADGPARAVGYAGAAVAGWILAELFAFAVLSVAGWLAGKVSGGRGSAGAGFSWMLFGFGVAGLFAATVRWETFLPLLAMAPFFTAVIAWSERDAATAAGAPASAKGGLADGIRFDDPAAPAMAMTQEEFEWHLQREREEEEERLRREWEREKREMEFTSPLYDYLPHNIWYKNLCDRFD